VAQPSFNEQPQDNRRDDTVRLWLSQRQWMTVLQRIEQDTQAPDFADDDCQRSSPRLPAHEHARCMIRLGHPSPTHGTYLVKLRNISATGIGFLSAEPFEPKTRCTVALQDAQGHGLVCAASVVWSRQVDEGLQSVGIRFDQAIDAQRFHDASTDSAPA